MSAVTLARVSLKPRSQKEGIPVTTICPVESGLVEGYCLHFFLFLPKSCLPPFVAAPDLSGQPGRGQEVFGVDCMFLSCQRGRPLAQEQEEPDAARPLPRPQSLQGAHQVPEGQRAQVTRLGPLAKSRNPFAALCTFLLELPITETLLAASRCKI